MIRRTMVSCIWAVAWVLALASTVAIASPMPLGSLLGSKNATLDGQAPLPHTTLLEGDSLRVDDGLAMVSLGQGNRMVLGRQTRASFLRQANAVTVSLREGNVSLYHPQTGRSFRIKAGDVTVSPAEGHRTLGQVAMVDGMVAVTAKDGALQVEKAGTVQEVSQGKTITIATTAAAASTPAPQGQRHIKHILSLSPAVILALGLAAEAGFTAWAIVNASSGGQPASPVTPGP